VLKRLLSVQRNEKVRTHFYLPYGEMKICTDENSSWQQAVAFLDLFRCSEFSNEELLHAESCVDLSLISFIYQLPYASVVPSNRTDVDPVVFSVLVFPSLSYPINFNWSDRNSRSFFV
uniref:Uncharacterized protein n=1 Tax=Parascaris univalens TaxID=6257 RepID=A0A915CIU3_PARUN